MSHTTQTEFAQLIETHFKQYHNALSLSAPSFENDGFITKAIMVGSGGFVEIRCGPAEYNIEIFIHTQKDQKRWSLAELMSIEIIRNWMYQKRPDTSGKPRLKAEIECAFCLLVDGLRGVENFQWVYS
ncbi:MAG: hypothetical protein ACH346_06870 [Chthoniobacterales bacterium]